MVELKSTDAAELSVYERDFNIESASSIKIKHGLLSRAFLNNFSTVEEPEPTNFLLKSLPDINIWFIPVELIIVLTKWVFPTPGGPNNNNPFGSSQLFDLYISK